MACGTPQALPSDHTRTAQSLQNKRRQIEEGCMFRRTLLLVLVIALATPTHADKPTETACSVNMDQ
jgi:hypothetical protein